MVIPGTLPMAAAGNIRQAMCGKLIRKVSACVRMHYDSLLG
jgi:hypothetical protein